MIQENQFSVKGMHCQSCVGHITKSLLKENGIKTISVDLAAENAAISFDDHIVNSAVITKLINDMGFEAKLKT